jgi:inorganic phosphate transporter, PiT family
MTDMTMAHSIGSADSPKPKLDQPTTPLTLILFFSILAVGVLFVAYSLYVDVEETGTKVTTYLPFILLFVALVIALGFEFVNGFHDTANAVATVIYTHSLPAPIAVVWSGFFNFLGVLISSGAVAFGIVSLLPVELILQVGSAAGFAMVFALLIAAIIWNLGTWYLGLPASSSHTLIGSIIGVGIANALMRGQDGTSGVDWSKATEIGQALLFSPVVGFCAAVVLLVVIRFFIRNPALYAEPKDNQPPPWWIRGVLILTCTSVSFAHGSNDGQKGMGLIMLILIGTVPTAYALNRALPAAQMTEFRTASAAAADVIGHQAAGYNVLGDPRPAVTLYVSRSKGDRAYRRVPVLMSALAGPERRRYGWRRIPALGCRPHSAPCGPGSCFRGASPGAGALSSRSQVTDGLVPGVQLRASKADHAPQALPRK